VFRSLSKEINLIQFLFAFTTNDLYPVHTVYSLSPSPQGLEVIEAHYLFGTDYDNIDIVVHPQSIVHSAVEAQVTATFK
jgi:hypothetical protein